MAKPVSRLGRGLSGIISSSNVLVRERAPTAMSDRTADTLPRQEQESVVVAVRSVPIEQVVPNPRQPRTHFDDAGLQELAASIRSNGILQPLLVRSLPSGRFELVAGERRWRAAKLAGLSSVPALVRDVSDAESLEMALVENLQREDLGPLERASAYQQYIDAFRTTPEALATRLGESRANVVNYLRILKLGDEIREFIRSNQLGMGQARAIVGIADPQRQLAVARRTVRQNLTVRQVEALSKTNIGGQPSKSEQAGGGDRHFQAVEQALSKALGMPVVLRAGKAKNSGRIVIRYRSLEEFDRIAEKLGGASFLE